MWLHKWGKRVEMVMLSFSAPWLLLGLFVFAKVPLHEAKVRATPLDDRRPLGTWLGLKL